MQKHYIERSAMLVIVFLISLCGSIMAQKQNIVFSEDFESYFENVPYGWNNDSIEGGPKWSYYRGGIDGAAALAYVNEYDFMGYNFLISPTFEVNAGYSLFFDYMSCSTEAEFRVYYSTDGGKSFVAEPLSGDLSNTGGKWVKAEFALPEGSITLGFMAKMGGIYRSKLHCYMDNVKVMQSSLCQYPKKLSLKLIEADRARISWSFAGLGTESDVVEYELMQNDIVIRTEKTELVSRNTIEVRNLSANTNYSIRLRTNCESSYSGRSEWSEWFGVKTECGLTNLPIEHDFNSDSQQPDCWVADRNGVIEVLKTSDNEDRSLIIDTKGDGTLSVMSEAINHAANDLEITCYIYCIGNYNQPVNISYGLQDGKYYDELNSDYPLVSGQWNRLIIYTDNTALGGKTGTKFKIWFKEGVLANMYLDNFRVREIPDCIAPDNIKLVSFDHNSAVIDWSVLGEDFAHDLSVYNKVGNEYKFLANLTSTDNVLKGLIPETEYHLYFYSRCNNVKSDLAYDSIVFTTTIAPKTTPYTENFAEGKMPQGWNVNPANRWSVVSDKSYSPDDRYSCKIGYAYGNTVPGVLTTPAITLGNEKYMLTFYAFNQPSYSNDGKLTVCISDKPQPDDKDILAEFYCVIPGATQGWSKHEMVLPDKYVGKNIYVSFSGSVSSYSGFVYIDDICIDKAPLCMTPKDLRIGTIETNSCEVVWSPVGEEAEWSVTYSYNKKGETDKTDGIQKCSEARFELTSLDENTEYDMTISVKALCGGSEESESVENTFSFRTNCVAKTFANDVCYTEDFTSVTTGVIPPCWDVQDATKIYVNNNKQLEFRNKNIYALPVFDIENNENYRLRFDYSCQSSSELLEIGVWKDVSDPETFIAVDSIYGTKGGKMEQYTVTLVRLNLVAGDRIAMRYSKDYSYSYLDNIVMEKMPACPDIDNITVLSVEDQSIWIDIESVGESTYEVKYGMPGFNPDEAGTMVKAGSVRYRVEGLAANSDYDVYVRSDCGNEYGAWSKKITVHTACSSVAIAVGSPLNDGFEHDGKFDCWSPGSIAGTNVWKIVSYGAAEGRYLAQMSVYSQSEERSYLDLPVEFKKDVAYRLSFKAKSNKDGLKLDFGTMDDGNFVSFKEFALKNSPSAYESYICDFIPDKNFKMLRVVGTVNVYGGTISLDDIVIFDNSCAVPTISKISTTDRSAAIRVTSGSDKWNFKISEQPIDPNTENGLKQGTDISSTSYTVEDLTENTEYHCYVQAVCGEGIVSEWSDGVAFTLQCSGKKLPYEEDFETKDVLDCWHIQGNGTAAINTNFKPTGLSSCLLSTTSAVTFITPRLGMENGGFALANYMLFANAKTVSPDTRVNIGVMTDINEESTYVDITEIVIHEANKEFDLLSYFNVLNDDEFADYRNAAYICISVNRNLYIDNLHVEEVKPCKTPVALTVTNVYADGFEAKWTAYENARFGVKICDGDNVVVEDVVETTLYSIRDSKKINSNHVYEMKLWAECDSDVPDTVSVGFKTLCGVYSLPFVDDFEDYNAGVVPDCWSDAVKNHEHLNNVWKTYTSGGKKCMMFITAGGNPAGNWCLLQTPVIHIADNEKPVLYVNLKTNNATIPNQYTKDSPVAIVVSIDGGETFNDTIAKDVKATNWKNQDFILSGYSGKDIVVGFVSEAGTGGGQVLIDEVRIVSESCLNTASVEIGNVENGVAEYTITDPDAHAGKWEVVYGLSGFNPLVSDVNVLPVDKKQGTIELNKGLIYDIYVRNVCGETSVSHLSEVVICNVPCDSESLPYVLDFENFNGGNAVDLGCVEVKGATNQVSIADNDVLMPGTKSFSFHNTGTYADLVLPHIDADIETLVLSFSIRLSFDKDDIVAGVYPKDGGAFIPVETIGIYNGNDAVKRVYFDMSGKSGKDYRIAVRVGQLATGRYILLDNIKVETIKELDTPRKLTVSDVRNDAFSIEWQNSVAATGTEFKLNGTVLSESVVGGINTYTFPALNANTLYTVQVRNTADETRSEWSDPIIIKTLNGVAGCDYTTDFEKTEDVAGWVLFNRESENDMTWVISDQDVDAVKEGKSLYVVNNDGKNSYFGSGASVVYAYRTLEMENAAYKVAFTYHSEGNDRSDYMSVYLVPVTGLLYTNSVLDPTDEWITVAEKLSGVADWTEFSQSVKLKKAGKYHLVFRWTNGYNPVQNSVKAAAVDNISVSKNSCMMSVNIKTDYVGYDAVTMSWINEYPEENLMYEYSLVKAGSFNMDDAGVEVEETSVVLKGLDAATSYEFRVRKVCGESRNNWSDPVVITTLCMPETVSVEGFYDEFDYSGKDLGCWSGNVTNGYVGVNDVAAAYSGNSYLNLPANREAVIYRLLDLRADENYKVSFYVALSGSNDNASVALKIGDRYKGEFSTVREFVVSKQEYYKIDCNINVAVDGVYDMAIESRTGLTSGLRIDSMAIEIVDCGAPGMFAVSQSEDGKTVVSWSGSAEKYNIIIRGGGQVLSHKEHVGNSIELQNLQPSVRYTMLVCAVCGVVESDAVEFVFTASCDGVVAVPYSEDFDKLFSIPDCWSVSGTATYGWSLYNDENANGMMRFDSHNNHRNMTDTLTSPEIKIEEPGLSLSFDYRNPFGGVLAVYIVDEVGNKVAVDCVAKVFDWKTVAVGLNDYAGRTIRIMITGTSNYSLNNEAYMCIDNMSIGKVQEVMHGEAVVCYGEAYEDDIFDVPASSLNYGVNRINKIVPAFDGTPVCHAIDVRVPNTDFYVDAYFSSGTEYNDDAFSHLTEPGSYIKYETSALGCDSIIHLTLHEVITKQDIYKLICEGDDIEFCGATRNVTGNYVCSENVDGIEVTTTLHLTVLPSNTVIRDTVCHGEKYAFGGELYDKTGEYRKSYKNVLGCDSTVTLHLHVISELIRIDTTICQGGEIWIDGKVIDAAGEHELVISNPDSLNCRQTCIVNVTMTKPETVTYDYQLCEDDEIGFSGFEGMKVKKDTMLYRTTDSKAGCDSITGLNVTFVPNDTVHIDAEITSGDSYDFFGQSLTVADDYYEKQTSEETGCYIVTHLHLTIKTGLNIVNDNDNDIAIVPNPVRAGEAIKIITQTGSVIGQRCKVEIIDGSGCMVYRQQLEVPTTFSAPVISGIYVVRIFSENDKAYMYKLVVL